MLESEKYQNRLIRSLGFIRILHVFDFVVMMPLAPFLNAAFQTTAQEFSLLIVAYSVSSAFFGLLGSRWIDFYDRKKSILFCLLGFLGGVLLCAFAFDFYSLMLGRIATGAFGGILNALLFTVVADVLPHNKKGRANAVLMSAFSICSVLGIPLSIYIASRWGWRYSFTTLSILTVLTGVFFLFKISPIREHLKNKAQSGLRLRNFLQQKKPIYALALNFLLNASVFIIVPFKAIFIINNLNFSADDLTYVYLVGGIVTFLFARLIGWFSDRYGSFALFYISCIISLFSIFWLTQLVQVSFWILLLSAAFFMAISSGRYVPAMNLLTSSVPSSVRGSFMSLQNALQQFSTGLATLIAGWILSEGASGTLEGFTSLGFVAVFCTFLAMGMAILLQGSKK
jgi:MFS transporter, DHA1 family, inner membrane transport protein